MKKIRLLLVLMLFIIAVFPAEAAKNLGYKFPVPGASITQYYSSGHQAIDIGASVGTAVYTTKSGTIWARYTGCVNYNRNLGTCASAKKCSPVIDKNYETNVYCNYGFGLGFIIKHDDGTWSEYAHMSSLAEWYPGMWVPQGTHLGAVGSTGNSGGPHLHFAIKTGGNSYWNASALNPLSYMDLDDAGNVVANPSGAWLSVNSLTVEAGEPIQFAFNANNATGFGIGIDRNGSRVYYHDNGNNNYHTVTFTEPGSYSAYISAYNSAGAWNDSNKVYFSVTPKKHKVSYNTDGGTIANGPKASFAFHGFNHFRDIEQMVIFTSAWGASTGTNQYGNEYIVDANNQVVQIIEHIGNATIPAGGFVISALDGTPASFCYDNIKEGDYISYDPDEMRLFVWSAEAWNAGMKIGLVNASNAYRDENQLILYDTNRGYTTTMTNEWGRETAISCRNQVVESVSTVGNMTIPVGGYVLSGHGAGETWLYYNIQADDYVVYDPYLGKLYVWEKDAWIAGSKLVYEGETYGDLPTPTKEGYDFVGWQNALGEVVTADTTVTETQDHILTATWKKQGYVVSFYMNGAYNEEYYTPITVPAGEDFVLPDEPIKFGSRFLGWGTSQVDIFPAYQAGSVYTDRKDITFYAIWQAEIYAECEMTEYINYFLCDLTFFNRATDFKLYIAKYKDEKFVGVESSIVTGDTASFILLKSEGVDEIRLFFWNTDGSLEPFGNTSTIYPYYSDL